MTPEFDQAVAALFLSSLDGPSRSAALHRTELFMQSQIESPRGPGRVTRALAAPVAALALLASPLAALAQSSCDADLNRDGIVSGEDLTQLLVSWGSCAGCSADIDDDGTVNGTDLASLLILWGESCVLGPNITSISPASGPRWGGTEVIVTGSNLSGVQSVTLGGNAAVVLWWTDNQIGLLTAAGEPGVVDLTVTAPSGSATADGVFTYTATEAPSWATVLEETPDPKVVTDPAVRAAIESSGLPWRVLAGAGGLQGEPIEMILIPGGTFEMGCSQPPALKGAECPADALPVHTVTLRPFYMSRTEITQSQWTSYGFSNFSIFSGPGYPDADNQPVENIIHDGATSFASFTGSRLPTEAEWEFAARAGTSTAFYAPNGGTNDPFAIDEWVLYVDSSFRTKPVGLKPANGFGLHDMGGNVAEMVQDLYAPDYYANSPSFDPRGPTKGTLRLARGGYFYSNGADTTESVLMSSSGRRSFDAGASSPFIGFRTAKDSPEAAVALSLSPDIGPVSGGQLVTIRGRNLGSVTAVRFECGAGKPADVTIVSQDYFTLSFYTPAGVEGSCGIISLEWSYPNGKNGPTLRLANAYRYAEVATPDWATLIEALPDPSVVTDPALRDAIIATGSAWRIIHNETQIEMVLIPAGSFEMGCTADNPIYCQLYESPVHPVTLTEPFYMARYEVTQAQWTAVMGSNPSQFQGPKYDPFTRPVEGLFWQDARNFVCTTGMRMPTEAEWEYAYRAGTTTDFHGTPAFPNGTDDPSAADAIGWFGDIPSQGEQPDCVPNSGGAPQPVGLKAANGFGLHDMAGNVMEWVGDRFGVYSDEAQIDPMGDETSNQRVARGGAWDRGCGSMRASSRDAVDFTYFGVMGFRPVMPLEGASFVELTSVSPATGPTTGGTTVTLTGKGFNCVSAIAVYSGGSTTYLENITSVNDRTIVFTLPPGAAGTGSIGVMHRLTTVWTYLYDSFTYVVPAPVVASISPLVGPVSGGTPVTITGTNLTNASAVAFDGVSASGVTVVNATTIIAIAPPGVEGLASVSVTTPGGTDTLPDAFGYYMPGQWRTTIEHAPDPAVVIDPALRDAIVASGLPWRVRDNLTQIEMLLIPAGTFSMGGSSSDNYAATAAELPVHAVTISSPFYIGRYEVTQAEWTAIMGMNPSQYKGLPDSDVRPVERVTWSRAQAFNSATGFRLPTEAEWEYACRAGTTTAFYNGNNDFAVGSIAWYGFNANFETRPVGLLTDNNFGLHDMSGNAAEWVSDWYSATYYASSPAVDPQGPATGQFRITRGGQAGSITRWLRSAARWADDPEQPFINTGFRVAREP
jgi:formylglycine-generating enzyme required for sulfatase activity